MFRQIVAAANVVGKTANVCKKEEECMLFSFLQGYYFVFEKFSLECPRHGLDELLEV